MSGHNQPQMIRFFSTVDPALVPLNVLTLPVHTPQPPEVIASYRSFWTKISGIGSYHCTYPLLFTALKLYPGQEARTS